MDELTATLHESRAYWSRREAHHLRGTATELRSTAIELCVTSRAIVAESRKLRERTAVRVDAPRPAEPRAA